MNNNTRPKRSLGFGNSPRSRLAVVGALLILVIVAFTVINSFLGSADRDQAARLTEVAKAQNEIVRVATLADQEAKSDESRNYAITTRYSVGSSQQEIKKLLAARGVSGKGLEKSLAAGKNPKTDQLLEEADRNNRYDETFRALVEQQLTDYQKLLQAAYDSGSPNEKKVLTASFESAGRLIAKPTANP